MPNRAPTNCRHPYCPELIYQVGVYYCPEHQRLHSTDQRETRDVNAEKQSRQEFYRSAQWRFARDQHLAIEPFCRLCQPRSVLAQMVDHVTPLEQGGNPLEQDNMQSLCNSCHARKRQKESTESRS